MNKLQNEALFAVLKESLKQVGMNYHDLAQALDTSEASIKSIFYRKECSLSRFNEICEAIGSTSGQIMALSETRIRYKKHFSEEQEELFTIRPDVFRFFCIIYYLREKPSQLVGKYGLTKNSISGYLKDLEKLKLLERLPSQRINFLIRGKLTWLPNGPWEKKYFPSFLMKMKKATDPDNDGQGFRNTGFISLSQNDVVGFKQEINDLIEKYQGRADRDHSVRKSKKLYPLTWLFMVAKGDVSDEVYEKE